MKRITAGRTASRGIAVGRAYLYRSGRLEADRAPVPPGGEGRELERFAKALKGARAQIGELAKRSEIFAAHLDIADDPLLLEGVDERIACGGRNAELALEETAAELSARLSALDDEYLRERSMDVRDVCSRIMRLLKGLSGSGLSGIDRPTVLVADSLTPSDAAGLDPSLVLGVVTADGGETSHVAIMARGLGIPAIVGAAGITDAVPHGSEVIVDAVDGAVVVGPDAATLERYEAMARALGERRRALASLRGLPAQTPDGRRVRLCANVGSVREAEGACAYGAEGVGLFRSEFLFMGGSGFPGEDEQFEAYRSAVLAVPGPLVVRTLDVGSDKRLPYLPLDEENPALGWRGVRMCLDMEDIFRAQLLAVLRASAFGDVRVMFPMVSAPEELDRCLGVLDACKREIDARGAGRARDFKAGVMVETPAAAICAPELARRSDFFSIGTNDLTQYVMAADRGNPRVASSCNPLYPAVLRAVSGVIEAGHAAGIPVAMCGELAGDDRAVRLLLGMGLDEFSMTASRIPEARHIVRSGSYSDAKVLASRVLAAGTLSEVNDILC